jgi:epoxyqueuosine reductase
MPLTTLPKASREKLPAGTRRHLPVIERGEPPGPAELAERLSEAARALGFARIGFAPVEPFTEARVALEDWLRHERHGQMAYLAGRADRADPRALLAEARTLVAVALACPAPTSKEQDGLFGHVARYARGDDYHVVLRERLRALADACAKLAGRPVLARPCVDTAPLLEREAAASAGLGFIAKSTLLIAPGLGSHVLLGELLVDVEIAPSRRVAPGCGACRACLDACPTGAFVGPHVLDARRCISYLTIELTGSVPRELRALVGTRVFGCDVCQDVCPFNAGAGARNAGGLAPQAELQAPDLIELLSLGSAAHRRLVRGTALRRVSRARLARNAAIALGNSGDPRAVEPLTRALASDASALVRGHAAWALGRLGGAASSAALTRASSHDSDSEVRAEAALALAELELRAAPGT